MLTFNKENYCETLFLSTINYFLVNKKVKKSCFVSLNTTITKFLLIWVKLNAFWLTFDLVNIRFNILCLHNFVLINFKDNMRFTYQTNSGKHIINIIK